VAVWPAALLRDWGVEEVPDPGTGDGLVVDADGGFELTNWRTDLVCHWRRGSAANR
jgi:hypothetical protein